MSGGGQAAKFSIPQARDILRDQFQHRASIYWADFLVSVTIGYAAAMVYLNAPLGSPQQIVCFLIAGFALFRVGSFIHEIVHFSGRNLRTFRVAWNLIAGVPMLTPSFFYGNHIDHHSSRHYGTGQDGEYLPLGSGTWHEIAGFFTQVVFLPIAVFARFLFTPISFLHPRLRQWTLEHASSFVINLRYRRRIPPNAPRRWWALMDVLCSIRAWTAVIAVAGGMVPFHRLFLLYGLGLMALGLNYVRNLVAHRYRSTGHPMSHQDQLADSINIEGGAVFTELFFPLGLRYHALHHLFPSLPYHNLGKAHRQLLAQLPSGSLYHQTVCPGYWTAVGELIRSTRTRPQNRRKMEALVWRRRRTRKLAA